MENSRSRANRESAVPDGGPAFAFTPSLAARGLHWLGLAERAVVGGVRRLRSRRPLVEPSEWRRPRAAETPTAQNLAGPPIVLLSAVAWDYRFQRPQQLARAFGRCGHPTLYVESFSRARLQPRAYPRMQAEGPLVLELRLPGRPDPYRTVLGQAGARAAADEIIGGLLRRPAFVLAQLPFWCRLGVQLRERLGVPLIYDRLDFHPGFEGVPQDTVAAEQEMIAAADLVAASSSALLPSAASRVVLVRNAMAPEEFLPADPPSAPPWKAGYVGALASWVDAAALKAAAIALPDWSFELAGRIETNAVADLRALPNVKLLGEIPYRDVPGFLSRLHVLVIPFVDTALTRAVDPVKLYEAMKVGVPVVSRDLPETGRWPAPLVITYGDAHELGAKLTAAVSDDSPLRRSQRRAAVAGETWSRRAEQLLAAVRDLGS